METPSKKPKMVPGTSELSDTSYPPVRSWLSRAWSTLNNICLAGLLMAYGASAPAATKYVATNGDDTTGDGSAGNPWATISHADSLSLLNPGDTVIVQAGTYTQASSDGVVLQNSGGTNGAPITYLANGKVTIDQSSFGGVTYGFQVQSPYIIISGFEVKGAAHGIVLDGSQVWTGNNCIVTNCLIHDSAPVNSSGVYLKSCQNALVARNVIYNINAGGDAPWENVGCGVRVSSGDTNAVWNNTIDNAYLGVFFYGVNPGDQQFGHISTLNNIVANSKGWGLVNPWSTDPTWFDSGYNLIFNDAVTYGNYPAGNNAPLANDVAADPKFVFPAVHDYHLLTNSPALDVGTNVGFPFLGSAPDIGAIEGGNPPAAIGTINGRITAAASGNPGIAGGTVQTQDGSLSTVSDVSGNYTLVVPQGTATLKASGAYLTTQTATTNVAATAVVTLNFVLSLTNSPKTNYVDNTSGNDNNAGTAAQPWKTIGNGDSKGLLNPGDTVMVNAGTYAQATANGVLISNRWGYRFAPVSYLAQGSVIIDQTGVSGPSYGFKVSAKGILLKGFEIKGAQHCVYFGPGSDSGTIDSCLIHDANGNSQDASGVYVNQSANVTISRNVIYNINASANTPWSPVGAGIRDQGANNLMVFNNTIDNAFLGVFYFGGAGPGAGPYGSITTENNIVANATGWAFVNPWNTDASKFVSGYNLVFNAATTYGNYPAGNNGPLGTDVAADPKFVNGASHNYQLQDTSPALNMGIEVGLPYIGLAPDMGALESSFIPPLVTYYVDNSGGNDGNPGTQPQPWKTISHGDAIAVLRPGDTVLVNAGTYAQADANGVSLGSAHGVPGAPITYRANGHVLIDQSAMTGTTYGFKIATPQIVIDGFEIKGATHGIYIGPTSGSCTVNRCIIHDAVNDSGASVNGIYVDQCANVVLTRNVIYNIVASANTPWAPLGSGIRAGYASNLLVYNNTIDNAWLGVFYHGPAPGAGPYGHITTYNNIVANSAGWGFVNPWNGNPDFFTHGYNLTFNDAIGYGNYPAGNNAPTATDVGFVDPMFVDPANGDYHLQPGSPAIDKGIDVGLPYFGNAPDIGAYETIDTNAPTVVSAERDFFQTTLVRVVFSERVSSTTANSATNYTLNNGKSVTAAMLNSDSRTVLLTTSSLSGNDANILTINNVQDISSNTIAPGTQVAITVPGDITRVQDLSADHLLVLEAEDYNLNVSPSGSNSWVFTNAPWLLQPTDVDTNYSGTGVMLADPNLGNNRGSVNSGPELDYKAYFQTPGTYYVWVRGIGDSSPGPSQNDSIMIGIDGVLTTLLTGFPQGEGYAWGNTPVGSSGPIIVNTTGYHLINVWMREDGFAFDKLLLTTNPSFTPNGVGPSESAVLGPALSISRSGNNLVLTWSGGGILQSATTVNGNYSDINGSSSPWPVTPSGAQTQIFYRVKQ